MNDHLRFPQVINERKSEKQNLWSVGDILLAVLLFMWQLSCQNFWFFGGYCSFTFIAKKTQLVNRLLEIALVSFLLTYAVCCGPDKQRNELSCAVTAISLSWYYHNDKPKSWWRPNLFTHRNKIQEPLLLNFSSCRGRLSFANQTWKLMHIPNVVLLQWQT